MLRRILFAILIPLCAAIGNITRNSTYYVAPDSFYIEEILKSIGIGLAIFAGIICCCYTVFCCLIKNPFLGRPYESQRTRYLLQHDLERMHVSDPQHSFYPHGGGIRAVRAVRVV